MRHEEAGLQAFLDGVNSGEILPKEPRESKGRGKGYGGNSWDSGCNMGMMQQNLGGGCNMGNMGMMMPLPKASNVPSAALSSADFIKAGQRLCHKFKDLWGEYCNVYGNNGYRDPKFYNEEFVANFLESLVTCALPVFNQGGMGVAAPSQPGFGPMGNSNNMGMMKRSSPYGGCGGGMQGKGSGKGSWACGMGMGMGMDGGDEDKAQLVERIKCYQRESDVNKQTWWSYCKENLHDIRDPNRHTPDILQTFVDQFIV